MNWLLTAISVWMLCSCAGVSGGSIQSSINGTSYTSGPMSADDPRLRSPQFYMDDDKSPVRPSAPPTPFAFGSVDGACSANCQVHDYPTAYCARACSR